jgi:hypothetical protein
MHMWLCHCLTGYCNNLLFPNLTFIPYNCLRQLIFRHDLHFTSASEALFHQIGQCLINRGSNHDLFGIGDARYVENLIEDIRLVITVTCMQDKWVNHNTW